jgi:lysophospholipase L1-like esterase
VLKLGATAAALLAIAGTTVSSAATRPPKKHITLVALGDSIPYGRSDCGSCDTFVDLFAMAIARHARISVSERNLSEHTGIDSRDLRRELRTNRALRAAVSAASVITVTIGHNDAPWIRDDDPCDGKGSDPPDWKKYASKRCLDATANRYASDLDAILKTIAALRGGKRTLVRVTNDYNDLIGYPGVPRSAYPIVKPFHDRESAVTCRLARKYGASCIDTYHAFNGVSGNRDAGPLLAPDHTHPNAKGHRLIAQLLVRAGYRPLFPSRVAK